MPRVALSVLTALHAECGERLSIALHFAELRNDTKAAAMLDFGPNRVGYAVQMSDDITRFLIAKKICVEVCLSSKITTESVTTLDENPLVTSLTRMVHLFASVPTMPQCFGFHFLMNSPF